eukprot:TRINITY_DN18815_c0_g1_i2.p1 TRINITY_DN18815_c0_g1~~TRINITY_DN18815_c0_g1_i2.p1  ORF type:complete len:286 (+),score=55.97 TRINITY_DN18815_c0_g1_i2:52-909(+)
MIRRPPRSTLSSSSAASDVYKRQYQRRVRERQSAAMEHAQQRSELAAAYRVCALHQFHEGVCNHLTVAVTDSRAECGSASLVIAHGVDWSEASADSILVFDNHTGAVIQGGKLEMVNQNCMRFHGRLGYDPVYRGLVEDPGEGERIAEALRGNVAMLMANHGVMVVGGTVAEAWHELYYLERACMTYMMAKATGLPLLVIPDPICEHGCRQELKGLSHYSKLHFEAQRRVVDARWPLCKLSLIHISEPTRLLSISYAVFCLKKKKHKDELEYLHLISQLNRRSYN